MKYIKLFEEHQIVFDVLSSTTKQNKDRLISEIHSIKPNLEWVDIILSFSDININTNLSNSPDITYYSILMLAIDLNKVEIVEKLLKHPDIDINKMGVKSEPALLYAIYTDKTYFAKLLLDDPRIDIHIKNKKNENALYIAANEGNTTIVEEILKFPNVDVNIQSKDWGFTPLFEAARKGFSQIVGLLLEYPGIDITIKDQYGRTISEVAKTSILAEFPQLNITNQMA